MPKNSCCLNEQEERIPEPSEKQVARNRKRERGTTEQSPPDLGGGGWRATGTTKDAPG